MNNTRNTWEQVLSHIKENVTPISYDTFLKPLNIQRLFQILLYLHVVLWHLHELRATLKKTESL